MAAPLTASAEEANLLVGGMTTAEQTPTQAPDDTSDSGTTASEVLPGNGTCAGYMLGHGGVIQGSEWVDVGPRHATRDRDYTIDYASGSLCFAEPVSSMDSVRVDYRYSTKADAARSSGGLGMLALNFGSSLQSKMLYAFRAADPSQGIGAQDIMTYGLNSMSMLGKTSSVSSMLYFSTPQASNRVDLDSTAAPGTKPAPKLKKDHLMVQNADLSTGKMHLKLGYQDVGQDFAGFASLRDSKAAAADVLNQLEKEKGLQRMNIAGDLPTGASTGLNFSFSRITDSTDQISSRAFGYTGSSFRFSYSGRDVGKNFGRFTDIKEADRNQIAAEAGISRSNFALQFQTGVSTDKKPVWSGLSLTQLTGSTGSLSDTGANIDLGPVKVEADVRQVDPTFDKLGALTDEERTHMALMARKEFDPNAPATQVTADDKTQLNQENGLDRTTCVVQVNEGIIDTWLSLSNVDSTSGTLRRRSINIKGGRFSAYLNAQSIDKTFDRIPSLQAVERTRFGNETGMTRTEMGGKLKLFGSDMSMDSASVVDSNGAGFLRQVVDFRNPRLTVRANFQNIDPSFSRIMDLSDADKQNLLQDQGFRRSEYAVVCTPMKSLTIDSYLYDSTNTTAGQTRGQSRQKIAYTPTHGPQINALRDDFAYISDAGNLSSYFHQEVKFDDTLGLLGGLAIKGRSDTYTDQDGVSTPQTTTVSETHLESNPKARMFVSADIVNTDYGAGRFENSHGVAVKTAAVGNLSVIAGVAAVERDSGKSEQNGKFGIEYAVKNGLKMTFSMANRDGGLNGSQQASTFSLNGKVAKRFLCFDDIEVASGANQTELRGKQTVCDNALKITAGLAGGKLALDNTDKLNPTTGVYFSSHVFQYETAKDPKKPFHLTLFRQDLITPQGQPAEKRNYSLDLKVSPQTNMILTSYLGKDGQNGAVTPVGGTVVKIAHALGGGRSIAADYTADSNTATVRKAQVLGIGITGPATAKSSYELYCGWCNLDDGHSIEQKPVFRAKYDTKIDADHYISFSLERKSGVDMTTINPLEGDTIGRVDLKYTFD